MIKEFIFVMDRLQGRRVRKFKRMANTSEDEDAQSEGEFEVDEKTNEVT